MSNHEVHDRVLAFIDDSNGDDFSELALAVFRHQFEMISVYQRYCEQEGRSPASVNDWRLIPPVPMLAFKRGQLCCAEPLRVFLTTGTTEGEDSRGRHSMPDLRLYRSAAIRGMRQFLFPDVDRIRILSLVPSARERPESSLGQMVDWAMESYGEKGSLQLCPDGDIDVLRLVEELHRSEQDGQPLCLMATTAGLIGIIDHCRDTGQVFRLPHSSRIMDTGGPKGATRILSTKGLLQALWRNFAVPGYFCVNEYGMTELSSQYYDNVIATRNDGVFIGRSKKGPHWLKTLVLDPTDLSEAPPGEEGLLCHFDLANAGTALAVLTEDIGKSPAMEDSKSSVVPEEPKPADAPSQPNDWPPRRSPLAAEHSGVVACVLLEFPEPIPLAMARGPEIAVEVASDFAPVDALGRNHDIDLCSGHVESAVDDHIGIHLEVIEDLFDDAGISCESLSHLVDVLKPISTLLSDPEMISAEELEFVDVVPHCQRRVPFPTRTLSLRSPSIILSSTHVRSRLISSY